MHGEPVSYSAPVPAVGLHAIDIYCYAARRGVIDSMPLAALHLGIDQAEVLAGVEQLVELGLIVADAEGAGGFLPIDLDIAAALLTYPMEREIYQRRELIARIKGSFGALAQSSEYAAKQLLERPQVERIDGGEILRGFLKESGDGCREEILVLQPNMLDDNEFDDMLQCYQDPLDRGVKLRIVFPHRCRSNLRSRAAMKRLIEAGAEVRTASRVPQTVVLFDREFAVIACGAPSDDCTVTRVRAVDVVTFLIAHFQHFWDTASPVDAGEFGYAEAADSLHQDIAKLMAQGFTDEAVARKLGMSVRTCRRHIAALMGSLDAVSRFQAGVRAAHSALIETA